MYIHLLHLKVQDPLLQAATLQDQYKQAIRKYTFSPPRKEAYKGDPQNRSRWVVCISSLLFFLKSFCLYWYLIEK